MMRGVLGSLFALCLVGGVAFAGDPMPSEQPADPKPPAADSNKFEVVKKDPPAVGADASAKPAKHAKHKAKHKARKHKKSHRKTQKSAKPE